MAETHINHLQQFQGVLEAVSTLFRDPKGGKGNSANHREITTNAGLSSMLSGLGRG